MFWLARASRSAPVDQIVPAAWLYRAYPPACILQSALVCKDMCRMPGRGLVVRRREMAGNPSWLTAEGRQPNLQGCWRRPAGVICSRSCRGHRRTRSHPAMGSSVHQKFILDDSHGDVLEDIAAMAIAYHAVLEAPRLRNHGAGGAAWSEIDMSAIYSRATPSSSSKMTFPSLSDDSGAGGPSLSWPSELSESPGIRGGSVPPRGARVEA